MVELEHNKHSVGQSAYHLVWKPKYNLNVFRTGWLKSLCEASLRKTATKYGFKLYEIKVMPDHVHLFVEIPPNITVSKALQLFKGRSAYDILKRAPGWRRYLQRGHKKVHLWSPGKFFRSVGNVSADVVERYIKFSQGGWKFNYLNDPVQKSLEAY